MSQLTIYKASAGSGKTFRLVMEYLKLLLENPYNYRHILAVTFTNKATTEMKERILRDLNKVAENSDSNILNQLMEETGMKAPKLVDNAQLALANILHDYDRFAVSTIDSFFQRVLRSFARDSGLYGTYEVDLDQDAVLNEACDRLLLSVEDDIELRNWLLTMSEDQLGEGKNWRINDKILELGKELYKESFQKYLVGQDSIEAERDKLKVLKSELNKTRKGFERECRSYGKKGLDLLAKFELTILDFKYKSASFANAFHKLVNFRGGPIELGVRFKNAINNVEVWPSAKGMEAEMNSLYDSGMNQLMKDVDEFIALNLPGYITAIELLKYIYALGVLTILNGKIREIGQEKNSLLLSEGNMLLKGIIGNNDAPFVYEKIGTNYHYFMIDEFQDTSVTQWENLRPLIHNSLSENHSNLVVGDVKQSIYRWRNSDWQLLNKHLKEELNIFKIDETTLESNWRSSAKVVEYNNRFFDTSKTVLQDNFNAEIGDFDSPVLNDYKQTILQAYADINQKSESKDTGGYIHCEFIPKADKSDYESDTLKRIVVAVKSIQDKGYKAKDIAILVKKNKQGKLVAEALLNEKKKKEGYSLDVISDDTLYIDSSSSVRFLIGLLRYILAPHDRVIQASVVYEYATNILPVLEKEGRMPMRFAASGQQLFDFDQKKPEKYRVISEEVKVDYFPFFVNDEKKVMAQKWSYLNLIDLTDELIHRYNLDHLAGEQANIQAFKDVINDFTKRESGNLHKFMEWWNQFGDKVKLQTAGERDAIRIMTIHKSKGLEFPVVILPFCDWSFAPDTSPMKSTILWCPTDQSPYQQFPILPVKFSTNLRNSHFSQSYYTELLLSYIDNLNVLYVAQTRAVKGLYLFTELIEKPKTNSVAGLLNRIIRKGEIDGMELEELDSCFTYGELTRAQDQSDTDGSEVDLSGKISHKAKIGESLRLRKNYTDFLDEGESEKLAKINQGKLFHELLSLIHQKSDLNNALQKLVIAGKIEQSKVSELKVELELLMANPMAHNWFDGSTGVLNETTVIKPGFDLSRPDRVMIHDNTAIVVDYKSTSHRSDSHKLQVINYMDTLKEMGFDRVDGYVWYLKSNDILNVLSDY